MLTVEALPFNDQVVYVRPTAARSQRTRVSRRAVG
jgi:hypothetical protein